MHAHIIHVYMYCQKNGSNVISTNHRHILLLFGGGGHSSDISIFRCFQCQIEHHDVAKETERWEAVHLWLFPHTTLACTESVIFHQQSRSRITEHSCKLGFSGQKCFMVATETSKAHILKRKLYYPRSHSDWAMKEQHNLTPRSDEFA